MRLAATPPLSPLPPLVDDQTLAGRDRTLVLLASDDPEPFEKLPRLLPSHRVVSIPAARFFTKPSVAHVVSSKMVESIYAREAVPNPTPPSIS